MSNKEKEEWLAYKAEIDARNNKLRKEQSILLKEQKKAEKRRKKKEKQLRREGDFIRDLMIKGYVP